MATTRPATTAIPRSPHPTGRGLQSTAPSSPTATSARAFVDDAVDMVGVSGIAGLADAVRAIRPGDGRALAVAGAQACALAARLLLDEGSHDYYSRLLSAAREIERAVPDQPDLTQAIKRVLSAGDQADGPVNGPQKVADAMEAEAARIREDGRRRR